MKFIHLSDLHLGKRVNEFSMMEDQDYILKQILRVIDDEQPDGVIIAGDVYDKSVPSAEAVALFDDFLVRLARRGLQVFVISGNHDSPERIAFGGRLMDASGIHMAPVYAGAVEPVKLIPRTPEEGGPAYVWMLPFVKPAHVRRYFPDAEIASYTDALKTAVDQITGSAAFDSAARNVLAAHQFVTGAVRSESEEISVGGLDNVDAAVFAAFDYVALGHIHGPQNILGAQSDNDAPGRTDRVSRIRYCGTPLKYSFSEAPHQKSVTVAELGAKPGPERSGETGAAGMALCDLNVRTVPLVPLRDMVEIRGTYEELMRKEFYEGTSLREDYLHVTLTDEEDIPEVLARMRLVYPNIMKLDYDNTRTRHMTELSAADDVETKSPGELFAEFYEAQNGQPMTEEQSAFLGGLVEKIWEAEDGARRTAGEGGGR